MSVLKSTIYVISALVLVFAVFDRPIVSLRRLGGADQDVWLQGRQPYGGLKLSLDLAARRQGRRVAVLLDDWHYCYPQPGDLAAQDDEIYRVPRTFETDFASIPEFARWAINPFGNHAEAAVIHDWVYASGLHKPSGELETDPKAIEKARKKADHIFRYAMKEQGVNLVKRNIMFAAVRLGGGGAFGRDDEWAGRFKDPESFQSVNPPSPRGSPLVVYNIDSCENLDAFLEN